MAEEAAAQQQLVTPTADATSSGGNASSGGGASSCGADFGGVHHHVAKAGCDIQARFGLTVHGIGYSPYHTDGMDLDIYTSNEALGNQIVSYLWSNYNVNYTIWQDVYRDSTGYEEIGHGHFNHVHVTFF